MKIKRTCLYLSSKSDSHPLKTVLRQYETKFLPRVVSHRLPRKSFSTDLCFKGIYILSPFAELKFKVEADMI